MASHSRLKFAPGRNLHTSHIRPFKRLGSNVSRPKQSSQSFLDPKFVTAIHGRSIRYQQLHTVHAPPPVRRQNVALVRNTFNGDVERITLSNIAASCALKVGEEVDARRLQILNGTCLRAQALVDFNVPRLNEHLRSMRQYRGDRDIVLLHLRKFLALAEALPANRSWKDLDHFAYRAIHTDLYRSMVNGDLEDDCKILIVKLEKLAASTSIELGDTIGDYYSGIPIDLSSSFWQAIIANAKAAARCAQASEEDVMDDSLDFQQRPIALNKWDAAYHARHGSPQVISNVPSTGAQHPASISVDTMADDNAPITFDTVEDLATQLVVKEYLKVFEEEMSYLKQCIQGEHSTIKADILKQVSRGVSSVMLTSKQQNFDVAKFIELAKPWLVAIETLHNILSAWHSAAVPESIKALRVNVKEIIDVCSAVLKANMSSISSISSASPAAAAQASVITRQDVGDLSAGLDISNGSTGCIPTSNVQISPSGSSQASASGTPTSSVNTQQAATVQYKSKPLFDSDFTSLDNLVAALSDSDFITEFRSDKSKLQEKVLKRNTIDPEEHPLVFWSVGRTYIAHSEQWFDASELSSRAEDWLESMKGLFKSLSGGLALPSRKKSPKLEAFRTDLEQLVTWLEGSAPAPASAINTPAHPQSSTSLGGIAASNTSSDSPAGPGLNVSTMSQTETQLSEADNAAQAYSSQGDDHTADLQATPSNATSSTDGPSATTATSPPPDEPFAPGSAPTVYTLADIHGCSDDDILHSKGAYHISAVTSMLHIQNLFTHDNFSRVAAHQKAHLVTKTTNRSLIEFADVRFLRTACAYIVESAKKPWWSWRHLGSCAPLIQFRNSMLWFVEDLLKDLPEDDMNHEVRCLAVEVGKMDKRLDGEQEATSRPRPKKELRKRVGRT